MKRILFFIVFLAALFLGVGLWKTFQNRILIVPEKVEPVKTAEYFQESQHAAENDKKGFSFENVSFIYDLDSFSDPKGEVVPALLMNDETSKPDGYHPRYIEISLKSNLTKYSNDKQTNSFVTINVYPVEEYKQAFSVSEAYVKGLNHDFAKLNKILENPSIIPASNLNQLPYIEYIDASQIFHARAKVLNFQTGMGFIYLTQYSFEAYFFCINNQDMDYVFQGLTSDNKYFVQIHFPISSKEMPESADDVKNENCDLPKDMFETDKNSELYKKYTFKIARKLDKMPPEKFTPDLNKIEDLIHSLNIK